MKKAAHIFFFLLVFSTLAAAQHSASVTMKVSATVISGASMTADEYMQIDLLSNEITGSVFNINTQSNVDTRFTVDEKLILTNEFGEQIEYFTNGSMIVESGKSRVELSAGAGDKNIPQIKGNYTGKLVASIQYL